MKRLLTACLLALLLAGAAWGQLFSADAESGDMTGWTWHGGELDPVVSSVTPITGTYSYLCAFTGTQRVAEAKWEGSARTDVYVRSYWLIGAGFDLPYDTGWLTPVRLRTTSNGEVLWLELHDEVAGITSWEIHGAINGNANYTFASGTSAITPGTAQCFELHYVQSATVGGVEFWINGSLTAQVLDQNTPNQVGYYSFGNNGEQVPANGSNLRFDNVVISTTYVGPLAGSTYSVTYDGNGNTGGTVPVDSNEYEEDDPVTVAANTGSLVRTGYTIGDWNTAANGTGDAYDMTGTDEMIMPAENVTLHAQWGVENTLYVRAGAVGTDDGSDWINAFPDMPASWTRGYTYYVAGGSYSDRAYNTAESGTTRITIQGATVADHGTDTGWSDAYTVADTPATFTGNGITFTTSYWVFDGSVGAGSTVASYGFVVDYPTVGTWTIGIGNSAVTLTDINVAHVYSQAPATDVEKAFFICYTGIVVLTDSSMRYCMLDRYQWAFTANGTSGVSSGHLIEHNYFLNGFSSAAHHGEQIFANGRPLSATIRYNVFDTCTGTGVIAGTNQALSGPIYGNIFVDCVTGDGIVTDGLNGGALTDVLLYNNTFVNCSGGHWFGSSYRTCTGCVAYNNLVYSMSATIENVPTHDYNCYIDTTNTPSEAHGQTDMSGDPFVGGDDYHLTVGTNPGLDLGSPYDEDMDGTTRTNWTRGAYEFGTATYSVLYNANGGTGTVVDAGSPYEETDTVTVLHPTDDGDITRTGHTFDHWDTQADDEGTNYAPDATFEMPAELVTLYAQWTINSYTLTYDGNGEDSGDPPVDGSSPYNYLDPVTTLPNSGALVKAGLVFDGWCTTADGTGTKRAVGSVWAMGAGNVTLFARWTTESPLSGLFAMPHLVVIGKILGCLLLVGLGWTLGWWQQQTSKDILRRRLVASLVDAQAYRELQDFDERLMEPREKDV